MQRIPRPGATRRCRDSRQGPPARARRAGGRHRRLRRASRPGRGAETRRDDRDRAEARAESSGRSHGGVGGERPGHATGRHQRYQGPRAAGAVAAGAVEHLAAGDELPHTPRRQHRQHPDLRARRGRVPGWRLPQPPGLLRRRHVRRRPHRDPARPAEHALRQEHHGRRRGRLQPQAFRGVLGQRRTHGRQPRGCLGRGPVPLRRRRQRSADRHAGRQPWPELLHQRARERERALRQRRGRERPRAWRRARPAAVGTDRRAQRAPDRRRAAARRRSVHLRPLHRAGQWRRAGRRRAAPVRSRRELRLERPDRPGALLPQRGDQRRRRARGDPARRLRAGQRVDHHLDQLLGLVRVQGHQRRRGAARHATAAAPRHPGRGELAAGTAPRLRGRRDRRLVDRRVLVPERVRPR